MLPRLPWERLMAGKGATARLRSAAVIHLLLVVAQGLLLRGGQRDLDLKPRQIDSGGNRTPSARAELQVLDRAQASITALPFVECRKDPCSILQQHVHLF